MVRSHEGSVTKHPSPDPGSGVSLSNRDAANFDRCGSNSHNGSVAVLESARLQMEPFATEDENALASSSREFRTGVQLQAGANVPRGSKTESESAKPAPLRLRDRAARSRMEDRSTDSDEAKSRAESDGISSTAREDGAELRRSRRQRAAPPAVNVNDNELYVVSLASRSWSPTNVLKLVCFPTRQSI